MSLLALAIAIAMGGGHLGQVFAFVLAIEFVILYLSIYAALIFLAWALDGVGGSNFDPIQ
jgi:hypothetical protein